jgi:predicted Zn-ribbon and HTH transcriptional regulator
MIMTKYVNLKWNRKNKNHYEMKGYNFTNYGDELSVLSEDLCDGSNYFLEFECDQCGTVKKIKFQWYRKTLACKENGFGSYYCKSCSSHQYKTKTSEEFREELYSHVGNEYLLVSEYLGVKTKILVWHTCGNNYWVRPDQILGGKRCPFCSRRNISHERFTNRVFDLVGDEYKVNNEYKGSKTKVEFVHNICGNIYKILPPSFLSGTRCPFCAKNKPKTYEEIIKMISVRSNSEFIFSGEINNLNSLINIKHLVCGFEYPSNIRNFLNSSGCKMCSGLMKKTTNVFTREIFELVDDEYQVLGEYINSGAKIKIKHNVCDFEWDVVPDNFLGGSRCPKCNSSKGERKIGSFLKLNNIKHKQQYSFADCINKKRLLFDFSVFDQFENLILLIEFDGKQHFEPVDIFGGEDGFIQTRINDEIKNEYCKNNNIELLRIPYWEFDNIEKILSVFFTNVGIVYYKETKGGDIKCLTA